MTGIFSKELRGRDITVNAVGPGPTATDLFFEGKTEGQVEAMAKLPPLERLAQPEDIASVVAFLAGRDGGWINGQTIRANGGMLAPYGIGYSLFAQDKMFTRECLRRFRPRGARSDTAGDKAAIAHFTDTYLEVNGVAKTLQSMLPLAREQGKKMDILTCVRPENVEGSHTDGLGPINFNPTGSFSIPEYPELTLHYPPALKIVQHCYENGYTLLHSATPGPMGLAALLTAKMLKLPIHATYHTAFPQYILELTGDTSLEEATWRYVYWYYNQMDVVFAPSAATMGARCAGCPQGFAQRCNPARQTRTFSDASTART